MLELIKELRERTHLGITACKKALEESGGHLEQALILLQKQGTIKGVDSIVESKEGLVASKVNDKFVSIVEINTQTDFAAKTEQFTSFVKKVLDSSSTEEDLQMVSRQLGEAVQVKKQLTFAINDGEVYRNYNHYSGKIAVLLRAETVSLDPEVLNFLDAICLQIAANNPVSLSQESIEDQLKIQQEIFASQVPAKAEKMKDRIIQGKIDKWLEQNCLINQLYMMEEQDNPAPKVIDKLNQLSEKYGKISLVDFVRFELGQK